MPVITTAPVALRLSSSSLAVSSSQNSRVIALALPLAMRRIATPSVSLISIHRFSAVWLTPRSSAPRPVRP